MADLYQILKPESKYYDRKNFDSQQQYNEAIKLSSTVYVGNLSFSTTQDSIRQLFERAGQVKQIIMGINNQGSPCGFCFVIFQTHEQAGNAVQFISKTRLNDRIIRVDWDPGYKLGRQKGRGQNGQQKREDFRVKEDAQRPRKKMHNNQQRGGQRQRRQRYQGRNQGGNRDYYRGQRQRRY